MGARRAAEMYFGQRVLDAHEALEWGLITGIVPPHDLAAAAETAARQLAAGPTRAFGEIRTLLRGSGQASLDDQLQAETAALARTAATRDATHGIESFMAKSRPDFQGW
jgi:2-(1,2-epoxy-1,2-dihydrophenyl)acetyl-CoA isomerase